MTDPRENSAEHHPRRGRPLWSNSAQSQQNASRRQPNCRRPPSNFGRCTVKHDVPDNRASRPSEYPRCGAFRSTNLVRQFPRPYTDRTAHDAHVPRGLTKKSSSQLLAIHTADHAARPSREVPPDTDCTCNEFGAVFSVAFAESAAFSLKAPKGYDSKAASGSCDAGRMHIFGRERWARLYRPPAQPRAPLACAMRARAARARNQTHQERAAAVDHPSR